MAYDGLKKKNYCLKFIKKYKVKTLPSLFPAQV